MQKSLIKIIYIIWDTEKWNIKNWSLFIFVIKKVDRIHKLRLHSTEIAYKIECAHVYTLVPMKTYMQIWFLVIAKSQLATRLLTFSAIKKTKKSSRSPASRVPLCEPIC